MSRSPSRSALAAQRVVLSSAFLAACGATAVTGPTFDASDDGPLGDAASADAAGRSDASVVDGGGEGGGACVASPVVGTACAPTDVSCDHVDPCCASTVTCDPAKQTWQSSSLACFQCEGFACGGKTCGGGTVCLKRAAGIDGGTTSYDCVAMPAACARDWSCGCVTKNLGASCTVAPSGGCNEVSTHVTVSCMGA